ncbi:estradiol 17-beta-dehydrogenase-like protein 12-B [Pseudovirgaria hyperparasitica]|uniref:Very-long-chain 3-oxoacyl-CoA reductase n=1 Tax=Pseudovirgaria hyperparasitica TaxID=470096 RepID=A0A6A6WLJ2_9PEZI|nr:estradiol 17-beta-dehydrogenase-like protein 12-B [Pseudovirgaria hyperparasitica]KAF2763033.1 estradiol 17-beta-dehydrogenase-like protein 12-B [Pseudovirgaria hyperparasitica]
MASFDIPYLEKALAKVGIHVQTDNAAASTLLIGAFVLSAYYIASPFISYIRLLLSLFVLPGTSLSKFGKKGSWAVITGASDGIGKEYALQIARKGFNIVLISRTQSKLTALAEEISSKYKVETKTLAMDFSANLDVDFDQMRALLDGLDVAILINNVGQSHSIPVTFAETSQKEMKDIITINCMGTLRTTQIVVPGMIQRKRGMILTMASFGGLSPTPLLATYSGSKAFLQQWSSALGSELAPKGVHVQLVQSYLVTSAMSKIRRASAMIPTPKDFVRAALGMIGRSGGAQGVAFTSTPYWSHGIMHWAMTTFLGTHNRFLIDQNKAMHESIRKRALRKAERDAKKQ